MNSSLISTLVYLAIAAFCLSSWDKYRTKEFLWLSWLSGIGFCFELIHFLLISVDMSQNALSIVSVFTKGFDVIGLAALIFVAIRYYRRK